LKDVAATDDTFTILPYFLWTIPGRTARVIRNAVLKVIAIFRCFGALNQELPAQGPLEHDSLWRRTRERCLQGPLADERLEALERGRCGGFRHLSS
jgi:hypothetical protein